MKYKDFFNIFTEAPINNLELVGNWEKDKRSSGWDPSSRKMLANPSYINKLKSSWNKSEIDFDVYLFKTPEVSKFKDLYIRKDFITPDFLQNEMKLDIPINPQNITIIFTNNIGDEKVPFTPWIMAHRLGHAIYRKTDELSELRSTLDFCFESVAALYGIDFRRLHPKRLDKLRIKLSNILGNFRSARMNKIKRVGEFWFELIAEYILKGEIKLNKNLPSTIKFERMMFRLDVEYQNNNLIEDTLSVYDNDLNIAVDNALNRCIGKIIVM
jgi:hypothetical protein